MSKRSIPGFVGRKLLILTCLAGGDQHGYALMLEIERMTSVRIGPGTLYGLLADLESAGFIEEMPQVDRRSPYRLTASGRRFLTEKLDEAERLVAIGRRNLAAQ